MRTETGVPVRLPCTSRRPSERPSNPAESRPVHPSQNGRHNPPNPQIGMATSHAGLGRSKTRTTDCDVQLTCRLKTLDAVAEARAAAAERDADADPLQVPSIPPCLRHLLTSYASITNHQWLHNLPLVCPLLTTLSSGTHATKFRSGTGADMAADLRFHGYRWLLTEVISMHGGMKIYRGAAAAARHYVEADRSRADDYYLAEGSGVAMHFTASAERVDRRADMDGERYERWVAGYDVATGLAKGRLRKDDKGVRFVEVTVNGPKTWSLAAALHSEIAEAYDAAQMAAAEEIIGWLAAHATTRVGPRDRQVQVPVEQIEAAVVRHFTSRAGDPHRHLHLQINARVFAGGAWRGLHTVGVRDSLEAINGIGHAAVMTNPEFREALARHGFEVDAETGEVVELAPYTGAFSARAKQIEANIDTYEAEWRADHPGEKPGPALRQAWDRRAWADARPDKVVPTNGEELRHRWMEELHELGYVAPARGAPLPVLRTGAVDRDGVVELALVQLGSRRSAWNAADARGEVERIIASDGGVVDGAVRRELAEDLTARVIAASRPLLPRSDVPEHVRSLTSVDVLAVEHEIVDRLATRAGAKTITVIEGAAGAGKTARLAATRERGRASDGRGDADSQGGPGGRGRNRRGVVLRSLAAPSVRLPLG